MPGKIYYAKPENAGYGFYFEDVHGEANIPANKKEVPVWRYNELIAGNKDFEIGPDENGMPILLPKPALSFNELMKQTESFIQWELDKGAQSWGYDNIASAISYSASSIGQFKADAAALALWRDTVWTWAINVRNSLQANPNLIPASIDDIIQEMPHPPIKPVVL